MRRRRGECGSAASAGGGCWSAGCGTTGSTSTLGLSVMGRGGVLAWSRPWAEFAGLAHHLRLQLAFQLPLLQPFGSLSLFGFQENGTETDTENRTD